MWVWAFLGHATPMSFTTTWLWWILLMISSFLGVCHAYGIYHGLPMVHSSCLVLSSSHFLLYFPSSLTPSLLSCLAWEGLKRCLNGLWSARLSVNLHNRIWSYVWGYVWSLCIFSLLPSVYDSWILVIAWFPLCTLMIHGIVLASLLHSYDYCICLGLHVMINPFNKRYIKHFRLYPCLLAKGGEFPLIFQ